MTQRVVVFLTVLTASIATARGEIASTGDVSPIDPAAWTDTTRSYVGYWNSGSVVADDNDDVVDRDLYLGFQRRSSGLVRLSDAGSTWSNAGTLFAGYYGDATMEIADGAEFTSSVAYLAYMAGSTSGVTVTGDQTAWTNTNTLHVGYFGGASLAIENGAAVSNSFGLIAVNSGSRASARVSGDGSLWTSTSQFHVGGSGWGWLEIADGGLVDCMTVHVGVTAGGNGIAKVSGAGSTWLSRSSLTIGDAGRGEVEISNGGSVRGLASATIGFTGTSFGRATVRGAGTTWTNETGLTVGSSGVGEMIISHGAQVSSRDGDIGAMDDSYGHVTVTGAGSEWITTGSFFYVGKSGRGTLRIKDGGHVSNTTARLGMWSDSSGVVSVSGIGSTWANSNDLYVGYIGAGTLGVHYGGLVSVADDLTIDNDSNGDSFVTMGSGGMLAISGQADGTLAGFLDLLKKGDDIRYWNEAASAWAHISTATAGVDYAIGYITSGELIGSSVLTVYAPTPLGDSDRNGMVDQDDYDNLMAQFGGAAAGDESADFNGDGRVDLADFSILRAYYGAGVPEPIAAPEAVTLTPEPTTMMLLSCGVGFVLSRCRRQSRSSRGPWV